MKCSKEKEIHRLLLSKPIARFATGIILLLSLAVHGRSNLKFKFNTDLFSGYQSNLLRQPDIIYYDLSPDSGSYSPVKRAFNHGADFNVRSEINFNKKSRLTFKVDGDLLFFPGYQQLSGYQGGFDAGYQLSLFRNFRINLDGYTAAIRKTGTDENSDGDVQIYEYMDYGLQTELKYKLSKRIFLTSQYEFGYKDYKQPTIGKSFDNMQQGVSAAMTFNATKTHEFTLDASFLNKKYRELLSYSYDLSGVPWSSEPVREYDYYSAELIYKADFKQGYWKLGYRPRYRKDLFADFYTYLENRISTTFTVKARSGTKISIDGAYRQRQYTTRVAAQSIPENKPLLKMNYYDIDLDIEQKLSKNISVFGEHFFTMRKTNTTRLDRRTYRSYQDNLSKLGVRIEF